MNRNTDIEFFVRIEPDVPKLTHQHGIEPVHSGGRTFIHKTRALETLEAFYVSHVRKFAPPEPWTCPIHLTTAWYFRMPRGAHGVFKTTKPDTDNLVKTLKDCLKTAGFFKDDALVAVDSIAKYWRPADAVHGVLIRLHDLTEENK